MSVNGRNCQEMSGNGRKCQEMTGNGRIWSLVPTVGGGGNFFVKKMTGNRRKCQKTAEYVRSGSLEEGGH